MEIVLIKLAKLYVRLKAITAGLSQNMEFRVSVSSERFMIRVGTWVCFG